MPEKERIALLSQAVQKAGGRNYIKWFTRILLWLSQDKRKFIEQSTRQSEAGYGPFLRMSEEKEAQRFTSMVHTCGFYDFFKSCRFSFLLN